MMSVNLAPVGVNTALMTAHLRGQAGLAQKPLCHDPWAFMLAGDEGQALVDSLTESDWKGGSLFMGLRTRFFDDIVKLYVNQRGFRQVVLLGAGMDTRAVRLAHDGVRFFEVDHPRMQMFKQTRLDALVGYPQEAATYVACDFQQDSFIERLVAAGFQPSLPTVVLWEGVTMYLSVDAVVKTLKTLKQNLSRDSLVVFDYSTPDVKTTTMAQKVAEWGEPFQWLTPNPFPQLKQSEFFCYEWVPFGTLNALLRRHSASAFSSFGVALASDVPMPMGRIFSSPAGVTPA